MTNVTPLPEKGVVLDLDTLERKDEDVQPPFVVKVGGKTITFSDLTDADWRDLTDIETPMDLLRIALTIEDRRHLLEQNLEIWKFAELMEQYATHYKIEEKIAAAKRQRALGAV